MNSKANFGYRANKTMAELWGHALACQPCLA